MKPLSDLMKLIRARRAVAKKRGRKERAIALPNYERAISKEESDGPECSHPTN